MLQSMLLRPRLSTRTECHTSSRWRPSNSGGPDYLTREMFEAVALPPSQSGLGHPLRRHIHQPQTPGVGLETDVGVAGVPHCQRSICMGISGVVLAETLASLHEGFRISP